MSELSDSERRLVEWCVYAADPVCGFGGCIQRTPCQNKCAEAVNRAAETLRATTIPLSTLAALADGTMVAVLVVKDATESGNE